MPAITNVNELQAMNDDLAGTYWLANDIDASATSGWNGGLGFEPIGLFTGQLDGAGHIIQDLFINRPLVNLVGLFSRLESYSVVNSLGLVSCDLTGRDNVGAISGTQSAFAKINKCFSTGSISGRQWVGGLVGYSGSVSGQWIRDCYSRANVNASFRCVGGLVGQCMAAFLDNCYSTGLVSGTATNQGGLIGLATGSIKNCFWDIETSSQATSDGGTGKTTAQMKMIATFSGWSIALTTVANPTSGYPFLGWQTNLTNTWLIYGAGGVISPRIFVPIEDKVTLELIRNVEMSAGGRAFIDKSGNFHYDSRLARMR